MDRLTKEEALKLYREAPLGELCERAQAERYRHVPERRVSYQIDRNVNYTNVCLSGCKFCNFHCRPDEPEKAYTLTFEDYLLKIEEMKAVCGDHKMKVILETGCLKTASNIKKAAILAMYGGADYIKTSTGKLEPAATPEAAYVMCQAIKEYFTKTGIQIGFKPAGGLNSVMDALIYYTIVKEVLGERWLTNQWFRMGTSRLANLLLSEIVGEETKFF